MQSNSYLELSICKGKEIVRVELIGLSSHQAAYNVLADQLAADGIDVEAVKVALKKQHIETPSWGYANSGTRFKAFAWPGAATTTRQKLDDAAMVNKMTGIAPTVALHIPWDKPEDNDYVAMRQYAEAQRHYALAPSTPTSSRTTSTSLVRLATPTPASRNAPSTTCSSAARS